jgi:hypothetical protein
MQITHMLSADLGKSYFLPQYVDEFEQSNRDGLRWNFPCCTGYGFYSIIVLLIPCFSLSALSAGDIFCLPLTD